MKNRIAMAGLVMLALTTGCSGGASEKPAEGSTSTAVPQATSASASATPSPSASAISATPTESESPVAAPEATTLTEEGAKRVLGATNVTESPAIQGNDRVEYQDEQGTKISMETLKGNATTRATRFDGAKSEVDTAGGGIKLLPELGKNSYVHWSTDDAMGGTFVKIVWGGTDNSVTLEVFGGKPSELKPRLVAEARRMNKTIN
ncbi:hypothetical protein AAEX63_01835 [Luteococcus sp. H138]|uniref:hypothetical protein n=1 Tax=Luteococcus sp. H138 TaxID=3139404 RepID=UPI00313AFA45